jgi:hypothetical protein
MSMAFPSRADYEALVYGIPESNPEHIRASTLRLYSVSAMNAIVEGEILFSNGLVLRVKEFLDFKQERIVDYSYTIYRGDQKIRWYDPQPHPNKPELTATFPHHFHEEPGIKLNRRPAPGISFDAPNLPGLIEVCMRLREE